MGAFISNLKKDVQSKADLLFANKYKRLGLTWANVKKLRAIQSDKVHGQTFLTGKVYFKNGQELLHGLDEIFLEEVYKVSLPNNAFILDCGAHIGLSVIYFKNIFPDATVVAFEPDKTNFDLLTKNVASFGYNNVELRNEAVWKENKVLTFLHEGNMSSKIKEEQEASSHTSSVKAIKLSDIITSKVDFLKLDIEGAEFDVLMDLSNKLDKVVHLFVEYHGSFGDNNKLNKILQLITDNGFKYYIKEASPVYATPFSRSENIYPYDVQLNIFCFR